MKPKAFARTLRRNMTKAEMFLWQKVRRNQLNAKFRRQQQIGDYIVDFVCFEKRLVIEVDGGQHCGRLYDDSRDEWLEKQGFKVLRFWNNDILKNMDGVLQVIAENISPSPLSPPVKGGERDRGKPPVKKRERGRRTSPVKGGERDRGKPPVKKGERGRRTSPVKKRERGRGTAPVKKRERGRGTAPAKKGERDRRTSPAKKGERGRGKSLAKKGERVLPKRGNRRLNKQGSNSAC